MAVCLAGEMAADRRLGELCCELGRVEEAMHHHRRFLEAAERQQDQLQIQRATATLGRTYMFQVGRRHSISSAYSPVVSHLHVKPRGLYDKNTGLFNS